MISTQWIMGSFEDRYSMNQTIFEPYPESLMEVESTIFHIRKDLWE
ncbi:MAG TPA: hypothetical protein VGK06_10775 [Methanosarcina sp.]